MGEYYDQPDVTEGLDPDGPSADDLDQFGSEYITCTICNRDYYDQSEVCPHCGEAETREASGPPAWAIIAAATVLIAFFLISVF